MKLFYDTIQSINAADYNKNQLDAWAPKEINLAYWNSRFLHDNTVVAEKDGIIVGIGTLKNIGYFDLLYVHKDYQRIGVATLIADKIEMYFRSNGITTVTTDASITARPFFKSRGYVVLKEQSVEIRGQFLTNFKMQKIFY
jgi:N-acetylglutamate synthase and related acetyltransferases